MYGNVGQFGRIDPLPSWQAVYEIQTTNHICSNYVLVTAVFRSHQLNVYKLRLSLYSRILSYVIINSARFEDRNLLR